jgi:hypothetical protein
MILVGSQRGHWIILKMLITHSYIFKYVLCRGTASQLPQLHWSEDVRKAEKYLMWKFIADRAVGCACISFETQKSQSKFTLYIHISILSMICVTMWSIVPRLSCCYFIVQMWSSSVCPNLAHSLTHHVVNFILTSRTYYRNICKFTIVNNFLKTPDIPLSIMVSSCLVKFIACKIYWI